MSTQRNTGALRRIGMITYAHHEPMHAGQMDVAQARLTALGHAEGTAASYRRCFGDRDKARTLQLAEELVAWGADIILSFMTNADLAALAATSTTHTPIVCWSMDPVDSGLVASAQRPGGNLTGVGFAPGTQWLQLRLLKALKPTLRRVACLYNPGYAVAPGALRKLGEAAPLLDLEVRAYECLSEKNLDDTLATMANDDMQALVVGPHEIFNGAGAAIARSAMSLGLPAVGLESVGLNDGVAAFTPDFPRIWDAAAALAHRILGGENPAVLPVDRHIKPFVILNLRSIGALGLMAPAWLIEEADHVVEP